MEEQFYLFAPLLIFLIPQRSLLCVMLAVVRQPVLRWVSPGFHMWVCTPWRLDSFLAGSSLAVLVRRESFVPFVRRLPAAARWESF